MLGRTANGLYWMFRYIERAENSARLIDAGLRMALTRSGATEGDWDGVLQSAGVRELYDEVHEALTSIDAIDFLLRDRSQSIERDVLHRGGPPQRPHGAHGADARDVGSDQRMLPRDEGDARPGKRVRPTCRRSSTRSSVAPASSAAPSTARCFRNEIFNFSRIGTFIERADNTARILDVKYYVLLPAVAAVGSSMDNVQWESILRSVSAHRAYGWVYDAELQAGEYRRFPDLQRSHAALACLLL